MDLTEVSQWSIWLRKRRREIFRWLTLLCYAGVLWWMALANWQIWSIFPFMAVFLGGLCVVLLAFRFIGRRRETPQGEGGD